MNKWIFGAALLLLTACTQDEMPDNGNTLPEGKYPLEIASVTMDVTHSQQPWNAPQTRVSESENRNSSVWQNGDKIKVQIADGTPGTYTYQDGSLTVADGDVPAYWASKNDTQPIRSWYTSSGSETVSLENQTNSLAYVLTANTTANFNQSVSLAFAHALAKVRVVLTGEKKDGVTDVKINTFTSCTLHADGTLTAGDTKGYIPMERTTYNGETCWEANVVPVPEDGTTDYKITHVKINDKEIIPLNTPLAPLAAKVNTIELKVNKKVVQGGQTITEPGDYLMTGEYTQAVTVNGENINLILEGVTATGESAVKIESGTATLLVKGTNNTFSCSKGPVELKDDANVLIKGSTDNPADSKLTVSTTSSYFVCIGSGNSKHCGNISIANVTLDAQIKASRDGDFGTVAIGAGLYGSCGDIYIDNSVVCAKGYMGSAAIGLSYSWGSESVSCGDIDIRNSLIYATTEQYQAGKYVACIGFSANMVKPATMGKVTVTTDESVEAFFGPDRFKAINTNGEVVTTGFHKVGKSISASQERQSWGGLYFNGQELASADSNGYQ